MEPSLAFTADFPRVLKSLWLESGAQDGGLHWLSQSQLDPAGFERALVGHASVHGAFKSDLGVAYDLLADLCLRHTASQQIALSCWQPSHGRFEQTSYRDLEVHSRSLGRALQQRGAKRGDVLMLAYPFGLELAAGLLAAWRLGLVVCPVEVAGPSYVQTRLRALNPAFVLCSDLYEPWLGTFAERRVTARNANAGASPASEPACSYAATEPVMRLVSPFVAEAPQLVDVPAHRFFTGLVRDAVLVLDAGRGRTVCWPSAQPETSLCLALATWLTGGTFLHFDVEDLKAEPLLMRKLPIDTLGVSPTLRDIILSGKASLPGKLRAWLRDPTEPFDWMPWDRFAQLAALDGAKGSNVRFSSAFGGAFLFGPKRARPHFFEVLPAAGQPFALCDVLGGGVPTDGPSGIYANLELADASRASLGRFLLTRDGERYLFGGSIDATPLGQPFLQHEIEEAVRATGWLRAGVCLTRPGVRLNDASCVLVGFADAGGTWSAQREQQLRSDLEATVRRELGQAHLPARIELFPLEPPKTDGVLDARWCESQWVDGLLARKAKSEPFRALSKLRRIVAALAENP